MAKNDGKWKALFLKAYDAGCAAGKAHSPTPMVVAQHANSWDDSSPVEKAYYVPSGVCGFAWVTVRPATSSFGRWLLRSGEARKGYYGGAEINCPFFNQSYERKMAYAAAFADVLNEAGQKAYAGGRLD